jgi:hypothetical protein
VVGKAGFGVAVLVLCALGRLLATGLVLPSADLLLAALLVRAFVSLRRFAH